ncbi:MAG: hypothetical protein HN612_00005, partial [Kordiimonadaceae bacterium]|nr:hypothetical protein [Kordiimonadaceae bacterium]
MFSSRKITVVGIGYVGLSNAIALARNNPVIAYDIDVEKVLLVNEKKSPLNELDIVKEETESIKEELEEEIKDASRIEKLKENITSLEKKIEKFHPAKILDTNFRTEVTKSEKKSN